jgi:hypothetical protein
MLERSGCCMVDQWIPENPLSIGEKGYEGTTPTATTGAEEIVCDGMRIDSPEAVAEHLERFVFPGLERAAADFDEPAHVRRLLEQEARGQEAIGPSLLKVPYGVAPFPGLAYYQYGYVHYLMAYALLPEVMEKHFRLQADHAERVNRAVARAVTEGGLPPLIRLDHDMADARGTLVDIRSLDRIWFPAFARAIAPLIEAGITLIWHCDGNLMPMVPRLLEVGIAGFQGFQYEHGMDYERLCRMKTRDGEDLVVIGGVSVTTTLPRGTPEDVRRELAWLVRHAPPRGFFLGCSSSITPGVPWENLQALVEGFHHYRTHGRG